MEETQQQQGLRRSLKARHMNMIAIGGAIGTGLFVAGGETVSSAGPGGALVAYALIGIMVYFLMTGLGEMASYLPVSGSFEPSANRYVDKSLGFALGWNYWFNWAITVAAELVAGALIMKYWFPDVPAAIWSGLFLIILFVLNYLSTRSYGESEFIFAGIKVLTVYAFSTENWKRPDEEVSYIMNQLDHRRCALRRRLHGHAGHLHGRRLLLPGDGNDRHRRR